MNVNFLVQLPVANPVKLTLDGVNTNARASFDKRRYFDTINATTQQHRWPQPFESTDPIRYQYYSNFPLQRIRVVDCNEVVYQTYTPAIAIQYKGLKYRSDAKFSSINDKLFIYFDTGFEYEDEDFLVPGETVALLGRLPNIRAIAGDIIRFKIGASFQDTSVASIAWSPSLQAQGYLTDLDYALFTPVDGLFEITYDEKEANLYSQLVNILPLIEGEYFIQLQLGVSAYTISFTSEPLNIKISHPKTLAIEYRHNGTFEETDIWSYIYLSDWTNIIRMPTDFYEYEVSGEVDLDTGDNGVPRMLRAVPYRQLSFKAYNIPGWMVDKLSVIFSHDSKRINEYYWENETLGEYNIISRIDLGTFEIKLRQVNDRVNFTTEFTQDVTAEFDPPSFSDLAFAGEVVTATFISNTLGVFSFIALPDWITADHPTFVNGDIIEFTLAPNATDFDRTEILTAISPDFDGLQATISFEQLADNSGPGDFIEISWPSLPLEYEAGAMGLIYVNASGPWESINQSGWPFAMLHVYSETGIQISEPTENNSGVVRTGVVRVRLISNPAIFQDITVTQEFRNLQMISLTPPGQTVGELPTPVEVDVSVVSGTQWQASSPDSWLSFDTTVHTGSATNFEIFVGKKPIFIPSRTGSVTFVNVLNSSDYLSFVVNQVDGE
jgi:hypothetical protein